MSFACWQTLELTRLIGHQNQNQKIQHHMNIKKENNELKSQVKPITLMT